MDKRWFIKDKTVLLSKGAKSFRFYERQIVFILYKKKTLSSKPTLILTYTHLYCSSLSQGHSKTFDTKKTVTALNDLDGSYH